MNKSLDEILEELEGNDEAYDWAQTLVNNGFMPEIITCRVDWENYFSEIIPENLWNDDNFVSEFDEYIWNYTNYFPPIK